MHFCRSWLSNIVSVGFMNLILLHFARYLFSVNTIFAIDKKRMQWNLNTKVSLSWKYFMFHEMTLKLYFMKCSERNVSQCILTFNSYIEVLIDFINSIITLHVFDKQLHLLIIMVTWVSSLKVTYQLLTQFNFSLWLVSDFSQLVAYFSDGFSFLH